MDADAVVIGSGPNGLAAAARLARAGWSVTVLERAGVPGGAVRTEALTLPGFAHDAFSAFYGMLHAAPAFRALRLDRRIEWAGFERPAGAAVAPERAATIHREPERTARELGALAPADERAWLELAAWWRRIGRRFLDVMLAPIPAARPTLRFLRAGRIAGTIDTARMLVTPMEALATERFRSEEARALLASGVTHTDLSVEDAGSTPFALILALAAQDLGMPVPAGGAGRLAEALAGAVTEAGGSVVCGHEVTRVVVERGRAVGVETSDGTPVRARRAVLADTSVVRLARDLVGEEHLPERFLDGIRRFRHGSGFFKVDLALDGPVPWAAPDLGSCGVVHLCGDLDAMARSAFATRRGLLPAEPMLVVGQQSLADPARAPEGKHTLWIECHVPARPAGDLAGSIDPRGWDAIRDAFLERVLDRVEAHAPGFRGRIAAAHARSPADLERENPNLVDGDPGGGSMAIDHQLVFRPVPGWFRYRMPVRGLYLCSASAHPGGGVHLACGWNAAGRALLDARLRLPR